MSRGIFISRDSLNDYRAQGFLAAAGEALIMPTTENRAAALLYTARAMMLIAEGDKDERARELAEKTVRDVARQTARAG